MYPKMGSCAPARSGLHEEKNMNIDIIGMPVGIISILVATGIVATSTATLVGILGRWRWQFELFSHFRVQYLILLILLTGISLLFSQKLISILGMGFFILNLVTIVPFYRIHPPIDAAKKTYRILLSNVLKPNKEYGKLCKVIQETQPDIIFLIEISDLWLRELSPILDRYPYRHTVMRSDNYGLAFYSRYSFTGVQTEYFSNAQVPSLIVEIDLDNHPMTLIGTHPPPPKSKDESILRNQQLKNIAAYIAQSEESCMLLGDLNTTSWSPYFREFMRMSRLRDSREGFGIQPTWPSNKPLFMVPIDHVLVSEGINVHKRFTGPDIGSDHRPVIVDFSPENSGDVNNSVV
jgi:endonuclease/exonuclease/phosphatase (EEP) superfamily protein YafD